MNYLILVKHSLPEIDPLLPPRQWPLSEAGRARCLRLAEDLNAYSPAVLVSSLEPKAVETARILATRLNKPFHTGEHLHEHDRTGEPFLG